MTEEKYFFEDEVYSRQDYQFEFEPDIEIVEKILEYKKCGSVLDLGCGEGGNSLTLAEKGFKIDCLDISEKAINEIIKESKKRGLKINAIVEDLENYEFNEFYDVIVGTGIFHFISKKKVSDFIKKIKEHTKGGGINVFKVLLERDPSQDKDSEGCYFRNGELKKIYQEWELLEYREYEEYDYEESASNKLAFLVARKKC